MLPYQVGILICSCMLTVQQESLRYIQNDDVGLNVMQMVSKYGYKIELHTITTEDGYVIALHRIPPHTRHGIRFQKPWAQGRACLLLHGLSGGSVNFVEMGPDIGLAYYLADRGFDVWLHNARGTIWSQGHTHWHPYRNASQFWNFSWHEIGYYDISSNIDYILQRKKRDHTGPYDSLYAVGHSQGNTALMVTLTTRPAYNAKIRLAMFLGPSVVVTHPGNILLQRYSKFHKIYEYFAQRLGLYYIPLLKSLRGLLVQLCADRTILNYCVDGLYTIIGKPNPSQLRKEMLPVVFSNSPNCFSTGQVLHYFQVIASKNFSWYDYGPARNRQLYNGSSIPPQYNISMATCPIGLYYGENDDLLSVNNVKLLAAQLPHTATLYRVPNENFNHLDFIWAKDVWKLLYHRMLRDMGKFA